LNTNKTHTLFLLWVLLISLTGFGLYVTWHKGFFQWIILTDNTRICVVIVFAFLIGSGLAGWRSIYLSRQSQYFDRIRDGFNDFGWFVTGLMIKLGLLGTVVGFIMMLSRLEGLEQLDISDIKTLMQQMTQGMGVAMNTTLVGLVGSILLGLQFLMLDRYADKLIAATVDYAHRNVKAS